MPCKRSASPPDGGGKGDQSDDIAHKHVATGTGAQGENRWPNADKPAGNQDADKSYEKWGLSKPRAIEDDHHARRNQGKACRHGDGD